MATDNLSHKEMAVKAYRKGESTRSIIQRMGNLNGTIPPEGPSQGQCVLIWAHQIDKMEKNPKGYSVDCHNKARFPELTKHVHVSNNQVNNMKQSNIQESASPTKKVSYTITKMQEIRKEVSVFEKELYIIKERERELVRNITVLEKQYSVLLET
jgi:hypothetical protein